MESNVDGSDMLEGKEPKGLSLWRLLKVCLLGVLIFAIFIIFSGGFHRGFKDPNDARRYKAIQHLKQVGLAIHDFSVGHDKMRPGQAMVDNGRIPGAKAASSNDVFRQLFQGGVLTSEALFSIKNAISRKPDENIGNAANAFAQALERGECPYLYVDMTDAKIGAPLCGAPLKSDGSFDSEAYNGKAVILMNDGSVITPNIDPDTGKVMVGRDGNMFDLFSRDNPNFNGKSPRILYPEH